MAENEQTATIKMDRAQAKRERSRTRYQEYKEESQKKSRDKAREKRLAELVPQYQNEHSLILNLRTKEFVNYYMANRDRLLTQLNHSFL